MKKILVLSSLIVSINAKILAQNKIDVLAYQFNIELNDANDTIYGQATIQFTFDKSNPTVSFDLQSLDKRGKGMKVTDLKYSNTPSNTISFNQQNNQVLFKLANATNNSDTASVLISYKGVPADGLIISKNKYGHRSFFADNWPNRGHSWIPCHDDPADKATVEFIVTAPQHYQVVANGIQIEETNISTDKKRTHWKETVPISTKVMVIGVSEFAVSLAGTINNCVPVYSWVYPEDRDKGFFDYALAADILPWFIKNVGPYAYKKLANVQSKTMFGGLENANTIFYSESSVTGDRKSEALLAHEIAHQWFGNYATEKSFAHLWLSEGFATYMTILYLENKYGKDTAISLLKDDRQQAIGFGKNKKLSVVNNTTDYMSLLNPNSYQKGGWVLHMLRSQLGDEIFWRSIQTYYATYGGKTADSEDLQKVFEKVSGKNLSKFFSQWLYTNENPSLNISWRYDDSGKKLIVTIEQLQETVFEMPLTFSISLEKNNFIKKIIQLKEKKQLFEITVPTKVISIFADPDTQLLFEAKIAKIKE